MKSRWTRLSLCAVGGSFALVSSAYPQEPGSAQRAGTARAEQSVSDEQARQAAQREAIAEWIVGREESTMGRAFAADYRASAKTTLASYSFEELAAVQKGGQGLGIGPRNLGDSAADLVFTPVNPCRVINTRLAGGPILAGTTRDFVIAGTVGFPAQGGNSGGCGIPLGPATAVVLNVVAVDAAGAGDLRGFPFGAAVPTASIINYAKVPDQVNPSLVLNVANGLVINICDPAVSTCTFDLTIQADVSATQVVADVMGYFRNVRREQVKSSVNTANMPFNVVTIGGTCGNYGATALAVTAPVAGTVVVQGTVIVRINHVSGTSDEVDAYIGISATDCPGNFGHDAYVLVPAGWPTGTFDISIPLRRFQSVAAASTTTFRINTINFGGTGHTFRHGGLDTTFTPN